MATPQMDLLYQQMLRDEVIYLHSLWHQGPPRAATSTSGAVGSHHLQPSQATQFKRNKKNQRKGGESSTKVPFAASQSSPGREWPVPSPPPPPPTDGWPSLEAKPDPHPRTLSNGEQLKLAAKHAHQHAVKAVTEFFRYKNNSDDDSDSIDSISDEDDDLMDVDDGREEYIFFYKVFSEHNGLRDFYEKNFAKGEFSCLVCGALGGKKMGKKYNGCLALVQHSITIAKTKKMKAHRAFGQAVCKVLGWDINELSSIVSLLSDSALGNGSGNKESSMDIVDNVIIATECDILKGDSVETKNDENGAMTNVVSSQGDLVEGKKDESQLESGAMANVVPIEGDIVEGKNDEARPEDGSTGTGFLPASEEGDIMNSLTCIDGDKSSGDVSMVHTMDVPAPDGLTNGIASEGNRESSSAIVDNVLTVEGKNDMTHINEGNMVLFNEDNGAGNELQNLQMDNANSELAE